MIGTRIFLRPKNRWLVNMEAIIELLFRMGLLGPVTESEVLQSPHLRVMHLESLSFAQQVYVMQTTDILITPHGAAIQNLMFMKVSGIRYLRDLISNPEHYAFQPVTSVDNIEGS
jgi:hypothetical protein